MRLSLIGSVMIVLALASLGPAYADAQKTKVSTNYPSCNCRFGYGSSCAPAVSCATEGGRCSGSCTSPPESK
jgi:hypothetical protein